MTLHSSLSTSCVSLFDNHIIVADGTSIPINGPGNVSLLSSFSLKDVVYVPKLFNNVISVQKQTHDLNCSVTFSTHCAFQDLTSGTIGVVKEQRDNFYTKNSIGRQTTTFCL